MKLPVQLPSLQIFLKSHPPHPPAGWQYIQPWESKQALRCQLKLKDFNTWKIHPTVEHQPSPTSKLLSCSQVVATLEKTCPQLPNESVVAMRSRTHLTCWAATHTAAQSLQ